MRSVLVVGLGGAVGSIFRYWASQLAPIRAGSMPWATLAVNLIGSFVLGLLAGWLVGRVSGDLRLALFVGLLGGFTTFSTFSLESIGLIRDGFVGVGLSYIGLSVIGGVGLALIGLLAGETLAG